MKKLRLKKFLKTHKYSILISLFALFVRIIGVWHGYPYIFNIDEPTVVRTSFSLFYGIKIERFDWPHFNYYFNFLLYILFVKFRALLELLNLRQTLGLVMPVLWNDSFVFYLISRIQTAILGALTIFPLYVVVKKMFNRKVALWSSFFLATSVYHIGLSQVAQQDVPMLFWLMFGTLYMYFASLESDKLFTKNILLAGLFVGIGAGYKYNGALFLALYPLFVILNFKKDTVKSFGFVVFYEVKKFFSLVLLSFVTFLITTFRIITDWEDFWSYKRGVGFLWQLKINSGSVHGLDYWQGLLKHLFNVLSGISIFGVLLFGVFLLYLIYSILKRKYKIDSFVSSSSILFIFTILFTMYMSRFSRAGTRYFMPVFGFYSIFLAIGFTRILRVVGRKTSRVLMFSVIVVSIVYVFKYDIRLLNGDTRSYALSYINDNYGAKRICIGNGDLKNNFSVAGFDFKKYPNQKCNDSILISDELMQIDDKMNLVKTVDNKWLDGPVLYIYELKR